jgi:hypothetical protein
MYYFTKNLLKFLSFLNVSFFLENVRFFLKNPLATLRLTNTSNNDVDDDSDDMIHMKK